jgi:hypothetical protein
MRAIEEHSGFMSDLLHTHLTLGMTPGCPACEQVEEDLRASTPAGLPIYDLVV